VGARSGPHVEAYRRADREAVAEVLARAFRDNALNRAVIGARAARRLRANRIGMRTHLPPAERTGRLFVAREASGAVAGALVAAPPFGWPFPPARPWPRLRCALVQGLRVTTRWARVAEALHREHLPGPHWYLATLGVAPAHQRRGLGGALVAGFLDAVDEDAAPAYLETDAPGNVRFYERAGFRVQREIRILGVPVWLMERPARAPRKESPCSAAGPTPPS
jgi:ribosomal protein S18 acetylase RimI-like enzyme